MQYTKEQVCQDLITYIGRNILENAAGIQADTPFAEVGLDSMSIVELVIFIERKYGVVLTIEYLTPENLRSVDALAAITANLMC